MKIYCADCETDPFEHGVIPEPFIWGIYDGEIFTYFHDIPSFIAFVHTLPSGIVYMHNGGKFDFHYIIDHIKKGTQLKIINGRLVSFKIHNVELRDSYSILPISLSKYNKSAFDYNKLKKDVRKNHMPEIIEYLKSDCTNLYTLVNRFVDSYGLHLTIASSAMNYYKRLGNNVRNSSESFYNHFFKFFKGGLVWCIESGAFRGDIKYIDINSAYPHAMTYNHPTGSVYITHKRSSWEPQDFIVFKGEILRLPPSLYTSGTEKVCTGWELDTLLKHKLINGFKIVSITHFIEYINFNEYVNIFYNKKLSAKLHNDKEEYQFSKLFLNSLYGKFAQNPKKYKNYKLIDPHNFSKFKSYKIDSQMSDTSLIISKPANTGVFYNVTTSASITGFVRAKLINTIMTTERPLYCDTDSLFYMGETEEKSGTLLGEWELENTFKELYIGGKKLYAAYDGANWKTATKGANLNPADIIKICNDQDVIYKPEVPTYSLKKGIYFQNKKITSTINR